MGREVSFVARICSGPSGHNFPYRGLRLRAGRLSFPYGAPRGPYKNDLLFYGCISNSLRRFKYRPLAVGIDANFMSGARAEAEIFTAKHRSP